MHKQALPSLWEALSGDRNSPAGAKWHRLAKEMQSHCNKASLDGTSSPLSVARCPAALPHASHQQASVPHLPYSPCSMAHPRPTLSALSCLQGEL